MVTTRRSLTVSRYHTSEIAKVKPHQVFYSPGGRRGWVLLTILVFVGCLVAVAVDWARVATNQLPPRAARYNTSVNYPRQIADGVFACAKTKGQYGDNGNLEVPVIGTGVFQRAAADTRRRSTGGPDHTIILTYDDGPQEPWTATLLGILAAYHVHATFFNIPPPSWVSQPWIPRITLRTK